MRRFVCAWAMAFALSALGACENGQGETPTAPAATSGPEGTPEPGAAHPTGKEGNAHTEERRAMVERQLRGRDITDDRVLRAMQAVPRHRFVPSGQRGHAYEDRPLSIGHGQTISQPYIVALMTQLAEVQKGDRVLEIGTGSGYQAAVLAEMGAEVYSMEIVEPLGEQARRLLKRLGYEDVHVRIGDGYAGWPAEAPFDAIVVTAAPPRVPPPLKEQLAVGGRMIIPVGEVMQELRILEKTDDGIVERKSIPVRFVPMTGEAQR